MESNKVFVISFSHKPNRNENEENKKALNEGIGTIQIRIKNIL